MLYFVYCEWVDSERLKRALPGAKFLMKATLPDHQLIFSSFTEDGSDEVRGGGCNLVQAPGEVAWGVLYDITEADLCEAERLSRVKEGRYTRRDFNVLGEDSKRYEGIAYVIKHPLGPSKPSQEYLAHMLKGGNEFGFPPAFVDTLNAMGR